MNAVYKAAVARVDDDGLPRREFDDGAVPLPDVQKVDAEFPFLPRRQLVGGQKGGKRHKHVHERDDRDKEQGAEGGQRPFELFQPLFFSESFFAFFPFEKLCIAPLISSMHRLASS